ncbi:MAG: L,D-transpeptidase [Eubacteriales bacterium]|nr:L,D-transpeptidase [Eubacteriales bacterium]MDD3349839.1 L,D-transpeptidase [Eubacteriales bacterium]
MKKRMSLLTILLFLLVIFLFLFFLQQGREELQKVSAISPVSETAEAPSLTKIVDGYVLDREQFQTASPGAVVLREKNQQAPSFPLSLKYTKYPIGYSYLLFEKGGISVFSERSEDALSYGTPERYQKLDYEETLIVKTGENSVEEWYRAVWEKDGELKRVYVKAALVTKRDFRFSEMEEVVNKAQRYFEDGELTYVENYREKNGKAPLYRGESQDKEGNKRAESIAAYPNLSNLSEFTYLPDGTLVRYLSEKGEYIHVEVVESEESFYVPNRYIPITKAVEALNRIIVIDRDNQNEAVYEKIDEKWTLVSYTLATTGKVGAYSAPTPMGFYYMMQKRSSFLYYKDGTKIFQGYAPYAIRFTGGAYIHGIPVDYAYTASGETIVPAKREYSQKIGTIPLSHKCVRNYTSHAKFLYDWALPGETIIIVI